VRTPREWVRICELEKAAIEHRSVEKWIEIDRKLDPNWTDEKSKTLYQQWLKGCTERLNEARANLRAAEDLWSLSLELEKELPAMPRAIQRRMTNERQLRDGMGKRIECRLKEMGFRHSVWISVRDGIPHVSIPKVNSAETLQGEKGKASASPLPSRTLLFTARPGRHRRPTGCNLPLCRCSGSRYLE
jgi:hypothetical protein